jgi:phosphatidate phosphatase APP1
MNLPWITIVPYRSFGTTEKLFVKGRVLCNRPLPPAGDRDSRWQNFYAMARRLTSHEVPGATVAATVGTQRWQTVADDEGYFTLCLPLARQVDPSMCWHAVPLELVAPAARNAPVQVTAPVMIPSPTARFAVVSDIDDTVIQSHAASLLRAVFEIFFSNARTRLPFAGVAALYQALQRGMSGQEHNPIFYVSSSPWNFYDLLVEFLERQQLPAGPMFLRDYGLAHRNKLKPIRWLLDTYPALSFLLIGDSGQQDPELYSELIPAYPHRIAAIFIRDVSGRHRDLRVDKLGKAAQSQGVPMYRVADSLAAAEKAAALGLIPAAALAGVQQAVAQEQREYAVIP